MTNLIQRVGRGIAPLVLTGALALGACTFGQNAQEYQPKPVEQKPKVTAQVPAPKQTSQSRQETPAQKAKREAQEYISRNGINLSVLEQGENVVDLYTHGYTCGTGYCTDQFVITDKSYPTIMEIDGLMKKLSDLRLNNHRNIRNIRQDDHRKGSDKRKNFDQFAKDSDDYFNNFANDSDEYMNKFGQNIIDRKYMFTCFDVSCNGSKNYKGKLDHMITGREAVASAPHIRNYLESRMKQENQSYQTKT